VEDNQFDLPAGDRIHQGIAGGFFWLSTCILVSSRRDEWEQQEAVLLEGWQCGNLVGMACPLLMVDPRRLAYAALWWLCHSYSSCVNFGALAGCWGDSPLVLSWLL
jgi:hypothetical protein